MKVVILAGGLGTRLTEETELKPKPMVEIGGRPILWHIMKHYAHHGFREFVICCGYKGDVIKRFFLEYRATSGSLSVNLADGTTSMHGGPREDWVVHLMDTGSSTLTGGRIRRVRELLGDETFMLTYGDGLCDVDFVEQLAFHRRMGKLATITAVRPPARFGGLLFSGDLVSAFTEKPQTGEGWINGGFLIMEPKVLDYFSGDQSVLEIDGLEHLAREGQLAAFRHERFWQCMDTLRDVRTLESLWQSGKPPWRVWK